MSRTPVRLRRALVGGTVALGTTVLAAAMALAGTAAHAATLFSDNFEDGNTSGWSMSGGTWKVVTDGSKVLQQSKSGTDARLFAGSSSWTTYTVQARVKPLTLAAGGVVGLLARSSGSTSYYRLALLAGDQAQVQAVRGGAVTVLSTTTLPVITGTWYTLAFSVSGSTLRASVDGADLASVTSTAIGKGRIGVQTAGSATAEFDDVLVTDVTTGPSPSPSTASPSVSDSPSVSPTVSDIPVSPSASRSSTPPASGTIVVARDGSGDFSTVQAAVDSVPAGNTSAVTVRIKPGTYRELVTIPATKPFITFVGAGAGPADVVITYDNANGTTKPDGSGTYGTTGSASVLIDGSDFTARNLTFSNSFDEAAHPEIANKQAVAVLTRGDRLVFDNVRFLGNQDTLYDNSPNVTTVSRSYYRNCYIEGDVDFIFGRGTAVFDHCVIHSLDRASTSNNGYVTAASTDIANPYGYLFTHCELTSDALPGTVSLGRPWHPSNDVNAIAQVVFRETVIGAHINPTPWADFGTFSWRDARYFEYHNSGPGSTVTADRPQLTDEQAAAYTPRAYLAGADGWNPIS